MQAQYPDRRDPAAAPAAHAQTPDRPGGGRIHHSGEFLRPAAGGSGRGIRWRIRVRMNLLLDTCTFLWIAQDSSEVSQRARDVLADPANDVYLRVVSAWEIAVKHALGR